MITYNETTVAKFPAIVPDSPKINRILCKRNNTLFEMDMTTINYACYNGRVISSSTAGGFFQNGNGGSQNIDVMFPPVEIKTTGKYIITICVKIQVDKGNASIPAEIFLTTDIVSNPMPRIPGSSINMWAIANAQNRDGSVSRVLIANLTAGKKVYMRTAGTTLLCSYSSGYSAFTVVPIDL